ncbi:hypothetical protein JKP88DRAFT_273099 [Tribonema minus]|uniref:Uncharacterized protein n=1 Tax=Tribonema minus TaxID=303371 RepID=A0A835YWS8_9STRA|nr:hypothetical protein JKP88DRAFT_273099 [Tribonema minus]
MHTAEAAIQGVLALGALAAVYRFAVGRLAPTIVNAAAAHLGLARPGADPCPPGMLDDGFTCWSGAYPRGQEFVSAGGDVDAARRECEAANPQGCELIGDAAYPRCRRGYVASGRAMCAPDGGSESTVRYGARIHCASGQTLVDERCVSSTAVP